MHTISSPSLPLTPSPSPLPPHTGVRLDSRSCEVLEAVLSRMQMGTLDLERTNLEDEVIPISPSLHGILLLLYSTTLCILQGVIALCEMIEFYGCASRIVLSSNNRLRPRAWLTIGRMLKKVHLTSMLSGVYMCDVPHPPPDSLLSFT